MGIKLNPRAAVKYLSELEAELDQLPIEHQAAFAAATVERQWPALLGLAGHGWRRSAGEYFRKVLDGAWSWLAGDKKPQGVADHANVLLEQELDDEESTGLSEKLMTSFATFCVGLDDEPQGKAMLDAAKCALEVVDEFLEREHVDEGATDLVAAEMSRQRADLDALKERRALLATSEDLRRRARGAPLIPPVERGSP